MITNRWGENLKKIAPFLIGLGAISYGIPGSLFELANHQGVTSGILLVMTFLISCVIFNLVGIVVPRHQRHAHSHRQAWIVMLSGTSMAFTNTFYIMALQYISVAVAAVMMMQSVWLSIVLAAIADRVWPSLMQLLSVIVVLAGTVMAAGLLPLDGHVSLFGMGLAFLAALAYAVTIQFTGGAASDLHPLTKARLMSIGALVLVAAIWGPTIAPSANWGLALKWGALTSFFVMVFPLTSFSYFMPYLPMGIGPILSSLELPASVIFAFILLRQTVTPLQMMGVAIIITTVIVTNWLQVRHWQQQSWLK